jgi:hypothetical protein
VRARSTIRPNVIPGTVAGFPRGWSVEASSATVAVMDVGPIRVVHASQTPPLESMPRAGVDSAATKDA